MDLSKNRGISSLPHGRDSCHSCVSTIQIGITLVGAISAAVGGAGASESIEPIFRSRFGLSENAAELFSILVVVLPLTYLSVVVGELVPKSLALKTPLKITLLGSRWLWIADRTLAPAVTVLERSTKHILRVFFPRSKDAAPMSETSLDIDALPQHHQQAILNLAHIERSHYTDHAEC